MGKKLAKWLAFRKKYLADKATFEGYYICNGCSKWTSTPEVDHIRKRSLAPDRVFDETNLQILCSDCHREKDQ